VWLLVVACDGGADSDDTVDSDTAVDTDTGIDPDTDVDGDPELGVVTYQATCANAGCHGADGDVGPASDLTAAVPFYTDERLSNIIQNGAGRMPGQPVPDEELADLLAYLRLTFP